MGFEQSKDQDEPPSPEKEKQNKYHSAEQHPQTLHNCTIIQGAEWECYEEMQQLWGSSIF